MLSFLRLVLLDHYESVSHSALRFQITQVICAAAHDQPILVKVHNRLLTSWFVLNNVIHFCCKRVWQHVQDISWLNHICNSKLNNPSRSNEHNALRTKTSMSLQLEQTILVLSQPTPSVLIQLWSYFSCFYCLIYHFHINKGYLLLSYPFA